MKYRFVKEVMPELAEESERDIKAVNEYIDNVHGTIIAIETLRSGQSKPYADSVDEALIFVHSPNVYTTNGPVLRRISREQAILLARMFVSNWSDKPVFLDSRLEYLEPEPNPCNIKDSAKDVPGVAACWRVRIRHPYND